MLPRRSNSPLDLDNLPAHAEGVDFTCGLGCRAIGLGSSSSSSLTSLDNVLEILLRTCLIEVWISHVLRSIHLYSLALENYLEVLSNLRLQLLPNDLVEDHRLLIEDLP